MKITIEISEKELIELNNAVASYGDTLWALYMGVYNGSKFENYKNLSDEELLEKAKTAKDFYFKCKKEFDKF